MNRKTAGLFVLVLMRAMRSLSLSAPAGKMVPVEPTLAPDLLLFEQPSDFRKMEVRLEDRFTIHGSSFVRPPIQAIALNRAFKTNDTFTWQGHEFLCLDTRGNSPGGGPSAGAVDRVRDKTGTSGETLPARIRPESGSVAYQDKVSTPTVVSNLWQISPHLFKFKRPNF